MTLVNIKCPHCGSEGHTDDEASRFDDSPVYYECSKIYGNCKDCSKEFAWDTYTNKATKEESK